MTDGEFLVALKQWFHPSQIVNGDVLWNPGDEILPWSAVVDQYMWYRRLGQWLQPKNLLEVGVGYGYSTLSMLSGLQDMPKVFWIDDESQWTESFIYSRMLAQNWFQVFPHSDLGWQYFSNIIDRGFVKEPEVFFDVIHIDANHEYEHVTRDAFESYNYAQKGAHWLFHDSDDPPVAKAAEEFADWNKLKWFKIPEVRCGMHIVHSCEEGQCPIVKGMAEMQNG